MNPEETLKKRVAILEKIVENLGNIDPKNAKYMFDGLITELGETALRSAYSLVRYFFVDPDLSRALTLVDNSRRRVLETALDQTKRNVAAEIAVIEMLDVINVLLEAKPDIPNLSDEKRELIVEVLMYQNLLRSIVEYYNVDNRE